jgi:hypothetical protein
MRSRHFALILLAAAMFAACSPSQPSSSSSPVPTTAANLPSPSATPGQPSATPTSTPEPTATPKPSEQPTKDEQFLLAGVRNDAKVDCAPRRLDLPPRAIAGVECSPRTAGVERIGVYLFKTESDLIATYKERMAQEGVKLNSGICSEGLGEGPYVPGPEDESANRQACFLNDLGVANYRATLSPVYIGLLGASSNTRALEDFAWKGNQDTPGAPTIWSSPSN